MIPANEDRYARQMCLPEVGRVGQAKLLESRVLVVGAGGLGCPALQYLVAAGVGTVIVCDPDRVEAGNLPRQTLYGDDDIGRFKAPAAVRRLSALNRHCRLEAQTVPFLPENADDLVSRCDVVLDCTDNFATRFAVHDACFRARRPLVSAAVHHDEGQLTVFPFGDGTGGPCLRCLWPAAPDDGCVAGCAAHGILGPIPGVFGALQADQALRLILGTGHQQAGHTVHFDLVAMSTRRTSWTAAGDCPLCGEFSSVDAGAVLSPTSAATLELGWEEIPTPGACDWLDARDATDIAFDPQPRQLEGLSVRAWHTLDPAGLRADRTLIVFCNHGIRSLALVRSLKARGHVAVFSLRGGLCRRPL